MHKTLPILLIIGLLTAAGITLAQANVQQHWLVEGKLIGTFAVENGDEIVVSAIGDLVTFKYLYYGQTREPEIAIQRWVLNHPPDRQTVEVCGRYVHVWAEWDTWHTSYSMIWELPLDYHIQFLPLVCKAH